MKKSGQWINPIAVEIEEHEITILNQCFECFELILKKTKKKQNQIWYYENMKPTSTLLFIIFKHSSNLKLASELNLIEG